MIDLASLFDAYSRKARLFPGLLTIFPVIITAIALFPALLTSSAGATLVTICTSCGLLYALAVFARSRGKATEKRLLAEWGGWPTTIWLRHRSANLDAVTRQRYHAYLERSIPGLKIPSEAEQVADPDHADACYSSAVKWLQKRCRGKAFPMIERENAEYGFRRNLRGLKPIGLAGVITALASAVGSIWLLGWPAPTWTAISPAVAATLAVDALAGLGWLFVVNDGWVRDAGDQYARALLEECEERGPAPRKAKKPSKLEEGR